MCRSETSPPRCSALELLWAPLTWAWAADSLGPMATSNGVSAGFRVRAHPHLYEINTRTWLERLSAQHKQNITLADVPDPEWDALAKLGFNVIWLMGVWKRSQESRRINLKNPANFQQFDRALPGWKPDDVISSPYAVAGYVPDAPYRRVGIARRSSRKDARAGHGVVSGFRWQSHGARSSLDARASGILRPGRARGIPAESVGVLLPVQTSQGTRFIALAKDPYYPPWIDVAQLNHFNPAMRAAQLAELRTIASQCDGVRCDMAMLQLNDIFANNWRHLLGGTPPPTQGILDRSARPTVPNLVLLAEAYWGTEQRLLDLGFSFAYDKTLYDAVRDINIPEVRGRLAGSTRRAEPFCTLHGKSR